MKHLLKDSRVELVLRWLLGATFLYSCIHKILEPAHFAKIIYGYYLFPDYSINLIAITLPFLELIAGIALLTGVYPRSAILLIDIMLFAFIIAISINLVRGQEFDCGCFSFGDPGYTASATSLLIRDIVCFLFGLHILFFGEHRKACLRQSGSILKNLEPLRINARMQ